MRSPRFLESSSVGSLRRCASGDSEFRIRDSGFPDPSPSGIRNRESGIPIGLRPKAALASSSVGSRAVRASGNSEFRIRDSGFPDHSPSGIRNLESGIPIGLRPQAALGILMQNLDEPFHCEFEICSTPKSHC